MTIKKGRLVLSFYRRTLTITTYDKDGESVRITTVPATARPEESGRCGHEYDCCGCWFMAWYRKGFLGLWSTQGWNVNI